MRTGGAAGVAELGGDESADHAGVLVSWLAAHHAVGARLELDREPGKRVPATRTASVTYVDGLPVHVDADAAPDAVERDLVTA